MKKSLKKTGRGKEEEKRKRGKGYKDRTGKGYKGI